MSELRICRYSFKSELFASAYSFKNISYKKYNSDDVYQVPKLQGQIKNNLYTAHTF